jgi:hypothetical protein
MQIQDTNQQILGELETLLADDADASEALPRVLRSESPLRL